MTMTTTITIIITHPVIKCFLSQILKLVIEFESRISVGILFHCAAPAYFTEFKPYLVVRTLGVLNSLFLDEVVL